MPETVERRRDHPGIRINSSRTPDPLNLQDLVYLRATNRISEKDAWDAYDHIVESSLKHTSIRRWFRRILGFRAKRQAEC